MPETPSPLGQRAWALWSRGDVNPVKAICRDTTMFNYDPVCLPCEQGFHGLCEGRWLVDVRGVIHSTCECPPCLVPDLKEPPPRHETIHGTN
jgi:hypothetical protein